MGCLIMKIPIQISGTCHKRNVNIRAGGEKKCYWGGGVAVYGCDIPSASEFPRISVMLDSFTMVRV